MNVIVNTIGLMPDAEKAALSLAEEMLLPFVQVRKEHRFIFLLGRETSYRFPALSNTSVVMLRPPAYPLLRRLWLQRTLNSMRRKHGASILLQMAGYAVQSIRLPQLTLLQDYSTGNAKIDQRFHAMILTAATASQQLLLLSPAFAEQIRQSFFIPVQKIALIPAFPSAAATPANYPQKESIKEQYTGGMEYFICNAYDLREADWIMLLKAYSQFKKKLKSGMKLVVILRTQPAATIQKLLETYRFREELFLIYDTEPAVLHKLSAAAYAWVDAGTALHFRTAVINALHSNVPVIAPRLPVMEKTGDNAFLYYEAGSLDDLSNKMMLIYKDETLRSRLIRNGAERIHPLAAENCFALLDTALMHAASAL